MCFLIQMLYDTLVAVWIPWPFASCLSKKQFFGPPSAKPIGVDAKMGLPRTALHMSLGLPFLRQPWILEESCHRFGWVFGYFAEAGSVHWPRDWPERTGAGELQAPNQNHCLKVTRWFAKVCWDPTSYEPNLLFSKTWKNKWSQVTFSESGLVKDHIIATDEKLAQDHKSLVKEKKCSQVEKPIFIATTPQLPSSSSYHSN